MSRLSDVRSYLTDRARVLAGVEAQLCQLQQRYESYYAEIERVREAELQQLSAHVVTPGVRLPDWLAEGLKTARAEAEAEVDARVEALGRRSAELSKAAEQAREQSIEDERALRGSNVALDRQEESLKQRSAELLAQIAEHNQRIRSLSGGFGFFANLFKMRRLQRQRRLLDEQQADVAARIDQLRQRWVATDEAHGKREQQRQTQWVRLRADAAAVRTKLDHLRATRDRIVLRTALEAVLLERYREPGTEADAAATCPRCQTQNPAPNHFCHICAQRLRGDRTDLAGSLEEMCEINYHHFRFSEGVKACQQIIGLVRGIKSGVEAFARSVDDVMDSENRYPLQPLRIDVPQSSVEWGRTFDTLMQTAQAGTGVHPLVFSGRVATLIEEVFTEPQIKGYFEAMGEELSRQAAAQW